MIYSVFITVYIHYTVVYIHYDPQNLLHDTKQFTGPHYDPSSISCNGGRTAGQS